MDSLISLLPHCSLLLLRGVVCIWYSLSCISCASEYYCSFPLSILRPDKCTGKSFTTIANGANVAYYMQSFEKGWFNYHQIQLMIDTLKERQETLLVVLPYRYTWKEFFLPSKQEYQRLDRVKTRIMKSLINSGKLYKVPPRCLDNFVLDACQPVGTGRVAQQSGSIDAERSNSRNSSHAGDQWSDAQSQVRAAGAAAI